MRIYLAGAIDKCNEDFCRSWRNAVKRGVGADDVSFIDPIEDKDLEKTYSPRYIYETDIDAVEGADVVFAEMVIPDRCYIGTAIELHHAFQHGIPIIVWGHVHEDHYFLRHIVPTRVKSFARAVSCLKMVCELQRGVRQCAN